MGHFEARAEVGIDNREAVADNNLAPCKVFERTANLDNILADNKDSTNLSEAAVVAVRSNMDHKMADSAFAADAIVSKNPAVVDEVRICIVEALAQCHLLHMCVYSHYYKMYTFIMG